MKFILSFVLILLLLFKILINMLTKFLGSIFTVDTMQYSNEYDVDLNSNHPVYSDMPEDEQIAQQQKELEAEIDELYLNKDNEEPMSLSSEVTARILAFAEEQAKANAKAKNKDKEMDKFSVFPVLAFAHNMTFPILGVLLLAVVWFAMKEFFNSNTFSNLKTNIMDSYQNMVGKLARNKMFYSVSKAICEWVEPNGQGYSLKFKAAWAVTVTLVLSVAVFAQLEVSKLGGREVSLVKEYGLDSETYVMMLFTYGLFAVMILLTVFPGYVHTIYHKHWQDTERQQKMMESAANNLFLANTQAAKEIVIKTMSQINTIEQYNALMKGLKGKINNIDPKYWNWMMDRGSPEMLAEFFLIVASPEGYRAWQQKQTLADYKLIKATSNVVQNVHYDATRLFGNLTVPWSYLCTAKEQQLISTVPVLYMEKINSLVRIIDGRNPLARVKLMTAMIKDKAFAEKMFAFEHEVIAYEYKTQQVFWGNKEIIDSKSELKSADWVVFIERYRKMMVLTRQLMPVFADVKVVPPSEDIAVAFTAAKPKDGIKMSLADTAAIIDALGKDYEYVLRVRQVDAAGVWEESKIINAKYFAPDDMGQYCTGRGLYQDQIKDGTIKPWVFDKITLENGNLCYEPYGVLLTVSAGVKDYGLGPENRANRHANVMNALFGSTSTEFNDAQKEVLRVAANWFTHKEWNPNKVEAAIRANLKNK